MVAPHSHLKHDEGPKRFKGRSKGKLKKAQKGRVELSSTTHKGGAGDSRAHRLNQLRQHRSEKLSKAHVGGNVPRIVALIPFHGNADTREARNLLLQACGAAPELLLLNGPVSVAGNDGKHRYSFTFIEASSDRFSILDVSKVADVIVPVCCPSYSSNGHEAYGVDDASDAFVTALKAQGLPPAVVIAQGLSQCPTKQLAHVKKTCTRFIHTLLPDKPKLFSVEIHEHGMDVIRALHSIRLKEMPWKMMRPHLLAESIAVQDAGNGCSTVAVKGFLRGDPYRLSVNGLVHVTGYGDFQVDVIETEDGNAMDDGETKWVADLSARQSLDGLCELNPLANEQSLITEEEIRECEEAEAKRSLEARKAQLMGQGMNEHQATWEAVMSSDDEDDDAGMKMDVMMQEDPLNNADEGADHVNLALKFRMERDELEFPDEVDVPLDSFAKDRFQKYRGMKQFSQSPWDPLENLPLEYGHIFKFQSFEAARKRVLAANVETTDGPFPGRHVTIYIANVPSDMAQAMMMNRSLIVSALFQYERQVSVSHFKVRRIPGYDEPVKSKDPVVMCCGFRRFPFRPIYTEDSPNCNKHRVERFLHAQRFTIASGYTRMQFGSANVLMFEQGGEGRLIATGASLGVDPSRLLIKRIVLTGYPIRVHKRRAVVRYMFFHADDIRWFKPVTLSTKAGLIGQIDEPLGMHGYFKCSFNGFLKYNDTVCMNLYKRQFPPWSIEDFQGTL